MKKIILILVVLAIVLYGGFVYFRNSAEAPVVPNGTGQTPTITYTNSSKDLIVVDLPYPGAVTGKDFVVMGKARGTWYFEASFPVNVLDKDGNVLWQGPAQAQSSWMTEDFVPFKVSVSVPQSYIGPATLVLKKDNPSGDPARDASISFPFTIEY